MKFGVIGAKGRMGKDIIELFTSKGHILVFEYDLNYHREKDIPEVIIDFSLPDALEQTISFCEKYKSGLVIGTTGFNQNDFEKLKKLGEKITVIQSYNFSTGIQILLTLIQKMNTLIDDAWDIELVETHHRYKKDAPSGTAIMLKNNIDKDIPIHSIRIGGVPGIHSILYGNDGEVIELKHTAISRRAFSIGALKSAEFIIKNGKNNGFFTFSDIISKGVL